MRYPSVHWMFCGDRGLAEQTTYRMFAQFYEEKETPRRKPNVVVDQSVEAFRLGILFRMTVSEAANEYKSKDPISKYFIQGWNFASSRFFSGDYGNLLPYEKKSPTSKALTKADFESKFDFSEFPFTARRKTKDAAPKKRTKG